MGNCLPIYWAVVWNLFKQIHVNLLIFIAVEKPAQQREFFPVCLPGLLFEEKICIQFVIRTFLTVGETSYPQSSNLCYN